MMRKTIIDGLKAAKNRLSGCGREGDRAYKIGFTNTEYPVRSAIYKLKIGWLVVGWVTTSEYQLLYVFEVFGCLAWKHWKGGNLCIKGNLFTIKRKHPDTNAWSAASGCSNCRLWMLIYFAKITYQKLNKNLIW